MSRTMSGTKIVSPASTSSFNALMRLYIVVLILFLGLGLHWTRRLVSLFLFTAFSPLRQ